MKPVRRFQVHPSLPDALRPLLEIAHNLRWAWTPEAIDLFRRLDRSLFEETNHDPVRMLGLAAQHRLDEAAKDGEFLARLEAVRRDFERYMGAETWYRRTHGAADTPLVAYFSMEFGITECLPIYSGGLGVLAGDHLKSASDLGIPLVGVGLLYQKGYFHQRLNSDGWQTENYPVNDFSTMPIRPVADPEGRPVRITLPIGGRAAAVQLWRAQVGRVSLILLDTHLPENAAEIREVTGELYGGDGERRLQQEILLGLGGMRALDRLGLRARVYHMNEGHSAFLGLERIRMLMKERSLHFEEAREIVTASLIFTTHTPVPAGIDVFAADLMERYFAEFRAELGLSPAAFLDLGRVRAGDTGEPFNTTVLAIRLAGRTNGVSRLHGSVTRSMWQHIWEGLPVEDVPITHVTNGVHAPSWISRDLRQLYDRALGAQWSEKPPDPVVWSRIELDGDALWRAHERRRDKLVQFVRARLARQLRAAGGGASEVADAESVLDPRALTIGFARRFATYKRATLLLSDPERLARLLNDPERPAQIVYAGKAHPRDEGGKELIKQIHAVLRLPELRGKIVFIENYDAVIARTLLAGCDIWLNTPRRPLEASGTSGMKAALNGVVNLSVLDGWWDEAWTPEVGFAVGGGEVMDDIVVQDRLEARALLDRLEHAVIPLFYDRDDRGVPRQWVALKRNAIGLLGPVYNTHRMVTQYLDEFYLPAAKRRDGLEADGSAGARARAARRARIRAGWKDVRVVSIESDVPAALAVGAPFEVRAWIAAGAIPPSDLSVELILGRVGADDTLTAVERLPMRAEGGVSDLGVLHRARVACASSGTQGFAVRVMPRPVEEGDPPEPTLIVWAG